MLESCVPHHDSFTASLTGALCVGLIVSYLPQHLRIIQQKSSEGFSPWFLLLGSTSSAAGMLNMVTLQWGAIRCCRVLGIGTCIEMTAGVFQVGLMWFLFTVILVLYMIYYPPHMKYVPVSLTDTEVETSAFEARPLLKPVEYVKTNHWALSIILSWVVAVHLALLTFVTFLLLLTTTPRPTQPNFYRPPRITHRFISIAQLQIQTWATFLGVSSAVLAAMQYAPQIYHTYHTKLIGALSIKMMLMQTPGAVLMVLSIALRPGTNWTSWIMYAVAGVMQGTLLVMCIAWKFRQRKLGIDDFGRSLGDVPAYAPAREGFTGEEEDMHSGATESTLLLDPSSSDRRTLGYGVTRKLRGFFGRSHQ